MLSGKNPKTAQEKPTNNTRWKVFSWIVLGLGIMYIPAILYVNSYTRFFWDHTEWFFGLVTIPLIVLVVLMTASARYLALNSSMLQPAKEPKSNTAIILGVVLMFLSAGISLAVFGYAGYLIGTGGFMMIPYAIVMTEGFTLLIAVISIYISSVAVEVFLKAVNGKKKWLRLAIVTTQLLLFILAGYVFGIVKVGFPNLPTKKIEIVGAVTTDKDKSSDNLVEGLNIHLTLKNNSGEEVRFDELHFATEINGKTISTQPQNVYNPATFGEGSSKAFEYEISEPDLEGALNEDGSYTIKKITLEYETADDIYGSITHLADIKALNITGKIAQGQLDDTDFTMKLDQSSVKKDDDRITVNPARFYGVITSRHLEPGAVELSTDDGKTWPYYDFGELKETAAGIYSWTINVPVGNSWDIAVTARLVDGHGNVIKLKKFGSNKTIHFGANI